MCNKDYHEQIVNDCQKRKIHHGILSKYYKRAKYMDEKYSTLFQLLRTRLLNVNLEQCEIRQKILPIICGVAISRQPSIETLHQG